MRRVGAIAFVALALCGCRRHAATPDECALILDRIVQLELHELGFRDPALAARKSSELQRTLAPELRSCQGVRIRENAIPCVQRATSTEEISHRCLR